MPPDQRILVVMRHGKAEQLASSDERRELTERGRADAAAAGRWMQQEGIVPGHALVSAAVRTAQTWAAVSAAAGWSVEADVDPGLYNAGTDTVLDLLRAVDDAIRTVLVIGHNPTMASLAQLLDDGEGDEEAATRMATGFPTSSAAVLALEGAWSELERARLVGFHAPSA